MAKPAPIPAFAPAAPLRVNATLPLLVRVDEALALSEAIRDPHNATALHTMRIAFKRLRYTLEVFAAAVPESERFLETLKRFQDLLGEIHDADVLAPVLDDDMRRDGETPGVRSLRDRTLEDRRRLYDEFIAAWDKEMAAGTWQSLQRSAVDAGRVMAAPGPLEVAGGLAPELERSLSEAVALLRLAQYVGGASPDAGERLARRVKRLARLADAGGDDRFAARIRRRIRRLAGALRKAV